MTGANDGTVKMWNFSNGKACLDMRCENFERNRHKTNTRSPQLSDLKEHGIFQLSTPSQPPLVIVAHSNADRRTNTIYVTAEKGVRGR